LNFTAISDLHGNLITSKEFQGETLLIGGDLMPFQDHSLQYQEYWFKSVFVPWLNYLKFKTIIFIAGNHDFYFENLKITDIQSQLPQHVHYLQNTSIDLQGYKIYGSPWILQCGKWAFSANENILNSKFSNFQSCNILLTHGPAFGFCDTVLQFNQTENLGSQALLQIIKLQPPEYVLNGHIHSGSHIPINCNFGNKITKFVGVSYLDDRMFPNYKPFKFKL